MLQADRTRAAICFVSQESAARTIGNQIHDILIICSHANARWCRSSSPRNLTRCRNSLCRYIAVTALGVVSIKENKATVGAVCYGPAIVVNSWFVYNQVIYCRVVVPLAKNGREGD